MSEQQTLIIYKFNALFNILHEVKDLLNFKIKSVNSLDNEILNDKNYLIISKDKNFKIENQIYIEEYPLYLFKFIEIININFLKNKFLDQSHIKIGEYNLDLNSRKISLGNKSLNLTERETNLIIFIKDKKNVTVKELQKMVWDYSTDLETHTVETHVYRLRKKMKETFGNESFILNTSDGYSID